MQWICFNGQFLDAQQPVLTIDNRSFKWGDGVFETIKLVDGVLRLSGYHFERLFFGLQLLNIDPAFINKNTLTDQVLSLAEKNNCKASARIRLAVFRDEKNTAAYSIEAASLDETYGQYNENGLTIGIYPFARKSCDGFSNLKTSNHLPYVMAGIYAKEQGWDDALVLNTDNHIADTSRANIFLVKGKDVYTPALNQGCVSGVMRRHVIDILESGNYHLHQHHITEENLREADEIFLTNALIGIKWVGYYKDKQYSNEFSKMLSDQFELAGKTGRR